MNLLFAIALLVVDAAAVAPTQCNACDRRNLTSCYGVQENQTCATDWNSLGTSHCGSVAIKYLGFPFGDEKYGFYRGCIDCVDKKAACFALGAFLQQRSFVTLLQCDIMCCTGNNCNNQTFSLRRDAITVFTPKAAGPGQCMECESERDAESCTQKQDTEKCDKSSALGTTHCGFAKYKFQDSFGVRDGFLRGCINCADKKAACAAISGYVKARRRGTVMDCNIECCTGRNCNDGADPSLARCNYCVDTDAASCAKHQKFQTCTSDRDSLGTTHCASLVAKYQLANGNNKGELFYRGCIDCKSKKEACFALGGFLKGEDDDKDPVINLLQCEIDCCTGRDCNTQVPTLSPNAIDVFTPAASGPKQCNLCLESDAESCTKNQRASVCATDRYSLGTSHCGSAEAKYRDKKGQTSNVFIRGCINCADKKAACAAVGGFLKSIRKIGPLMECEIECCTGDNCNTKFPSESKGESQGSAAAAIWQGYHILPCALLVLATTMAKM